MSEVSYIVVDTGEKAIQLMMSDIGNIENGKQISEVVQINNPIIKFLYRAHMSYAIFCKVRLPFKSIWDKFCMLDSVIPTDKECYIVIVNGVIHRFTSEYLNRIEEMNNVHLCLLLIDPLDMIVENSKRIFREVHFEQIYSFQKRDCKKYGFYYTNTIYSKCSIAKKEVLNDLYFIGVDKGRIEKIYIIYKKITDLGYKCDFTVVVNKGQLKNYCSKYPGINFIDKRISYDEILDRVMASRGILEVMQDGQDGATMRFYEALFYNKYLITNNKSVLNHPYYNAKYMQVIKDSNDIDINRFGNLEQVDYKYDGKLSPIYLFDEIVKRTKL